MFSCGLISIFIYNNYYRFKHSSFSLIIFSDVLFSCTQRHNTENVFLFLKQSYLNLNIMIKIRKGKKSDLPDILSLIKELAEYENSANQVSITLEQLENDGFSKKPSYYFLIAEKSNEIIGMSFYWIRYSTWKGKFLFLEDFVIKKQHRRSGVGKALFNETIKICQKNQLNGMCWQVLDWNTPAINFYKKYNAEISGEWLSGKLTKEQIESFNF
jgi:GNAT superfamily N-acetyltransferase